MTPDRLPADWRDALADEFAAPYFAKLAAFVAEERAAHTVYPPEEDVFSAFRATPLKKVKVLLLGQDPYHGPGQAHGMCFSVRPGVRTPPSLANMFRELHAELGCKIPNNGYLVEWAERGVLLLNAVLTVRAGEAELAQGPRLGDVHRRRHPRPGRTREARRLRPVGRLRPEEGEAGDGRPAPRRQGGPPVAAVGGEVHGVEAVLGHRRGARGGRRGADRLADIGPVGRAPARAKQKQAACCRTPNHLDCGEHRRFVFLVRPPIAGSSMLTTAGLFSLRPLRVSSPATRLPSSSASSCSSCRATSATSRWSTSSRAGPPGPP